ncbi:MAG: metallophosphoesterase [Proteobacteria bacterium]|nr:metallophosphoesterase [Pseudomonadota bacterium]
MMKTKEFPLIVSPNLGCPKIISLEGIRRGETISLIIAGRYGQFSSPLGDAFQGTLYLRPSSGQDEDTKDIPLYLAHDPQEITDWNLLSDFSEVEGTQKIMNSELHYHVLGKDIRYWHVEVMLNEDDTKDYKTLLRKKGRKYLPRLYDLIFKEKAGKGEKVNYHSVQITKSINGDCNFIHLTDVHIAKRNDEILDEVLKVRSKRERKAIIDSYINFNDKLREFIRIANDMADRGELDFVVITGDLVDFAFHGWEDEPNPAENNWRTFIHIITGTEAEQAKGNPGLKVAVFTSTGNHDWRLHPYDPNLLDYHESFGLEEDELEHYDYKSFDSQEYPEDRRAKRSRELTSNAFKKLNIDAFTDKGKIRLAKFLSSKMTTWVLRALAALGLGGAGVAGFAEKFAYTAIIIVLWLLVWGAKKYMEYKVRKLVDVLVDNPLNAEAKAFHYYLAHINPYLDYAFQYGNHSFIVMDTGADVFIGQLLDGKELKHIKHMSLEDNILGGSPDSRAFDSERTYYNWSQIVWLEKVLTTVSQELDGQGKTFLFLHAPPINPDKDRKWKDLWESERPAPKWIAKDECNLTYGTINHYLSQFFYLCMGYRESELVKQEVEPSLREVDLIFSGHAHRNIEFRLEKEWVATDKKHEIRIYSDVYSQILNKGNPERNWEKHKPVIVQTASCGLHGKYDENPPYYRKITIDGTGQITGFRVRDKQGLVDFKTPPLSEP